MPLPSHNTAETHRRNVVMMNKECIIVAPSAPELLMRTRSAYPCITCIMLKMADTSTMQVVVILILMPFSRVMSALECRKDVDNCAEIPVKGK